MTTEHDSKDALVIHNGWALVSSNAIEAMYGKEGKERNERLKDAPFFAVHGILAYPDPNSPPDAMAQGIAGSRRVDLSREADNLGIFDHVRTHVESVLHNNDDVLEAVKVLIDHGNSVKQEMWANENLVCRNGQPYQGVENGDLRSIFGEAIKTAGFEIGYKEARKAMREMEAAGNKPSAKMIEDLDEAREEWKRRNFHEFNIDVDAHLGHVPEAEVRGLSGNDPSPAGIAEPVVDAEFEDVPAPNPEPEPLASNPLPFDELRQQPTQAGAGGLDWEKVADAIKDRLVLPENPRDQLRVVRRELHILESFPGDINVGLADDQAKRLERVKADMHPEVKREYEQRLILRDVFGLIRNANGNIEPQKVPGQINIKGAVDKAKANGHLITDTTISLFFKPKSQDQIRRTRERGGVTAMEGYDFPGAWDLLQRANFSYKELLEEMNEYRERNGQRTFDVDERGYVVQDDDPANGVVRTSYFSEPWGARKEAVNEYLYHLLEVRGRVDSRQNAVKSLELANEMAEVTFESSVFNRSSQTGNDQLSQCIGFRERRIRKEKDGQLIGPQETVNRTPGFGTSWIRFLSSDDQVRSNPNIPVTSDMIDPSKTGRSAWESFPQVFLSKYWEMHELLSMREYDAKEILGNDYFNNVNRAFTVCDPDGTLRLKYWFLYGLMAMTAPKVANRGREWEGGYFVTLRKNATKKLSNSAGPFITNKEFDRAQKDSAVWRSVRSDGTKQQIGDGLASLFGLASSPPRKKR